jgi:hypothetical protein
MSVCVYRVYAYDEIDENVQSLERYHHAHGSALAPLLLSRFGSSSGVQSLGRTSRPALCAQRLALTQALAVYRF